MALRYGYAGNMGSWVDVVKQYGKDAVGGAAKAVVSTAARKAAGGGAKPAPPPKPIPRPAAKKTQWGKIGLIGGGIVAALLLGAKLMSGRGRR